MTKPYPAGHKITSRLFARHYDVNDITKSTNTTFGMLIVSGRLKSPVGILL